MALDSALYTLHFVPRQSAPSIVDLYSNLPLASTDHRPPEYTLSRSIRCHQYSSTLLDGLTHVELANVSGPSTADKLKVLKLLNPDFTHELNRKSQAFKPAWGFHWQGENFLVTREGTFGSSAPSFDVEIIRKPDPPIKVAMYRPESKKTPAFLQIFDYNINRIEGVTDKRGLEQSLILGIASCLDHDFDDRHRDPQTNIFLPMPGQSAAPHSTEPLSSPSLEPNEVFITPLVEPAHIVQHCLNLLKSSDATIDQSNANRGQGLEMIVVLAQGEDMAQRALGIAERVKVGFYRLPSEVKGLRWDGHVPDELFMYVRPLEAPSPKQSDAAANEAQRQSPNGNTRTVRPRIVLGEPKNPQSAPRSPREEVKSTSIPLMGIKIYLSKSKLEEFEIEQAQKARLREEDQSRRLAEKLQRQEGQSVQPSTLSRKPAASSSPVPLEQSSTASSQGDSNETVSGSVSESVDYAQRRRRDVLRLLRNENARQSTEVALLNEAAANQHLPGPEETQGNNDDANSDAGSHWSNQSCASSNGNPTLPDDDEGEETPRASIQLQLRHSQTGSAFSMARASSTLDPQMRLDESTRASMTGSSIEIKRMSTASKTVQRRAHSIAGQQLPQTESPGPPSESAPRTWRSPFLLDELDTARRASSSFASIDARVMNLQDDGDEDEADLGAFTLALSAVDTGSPEPRPQSSLALCRTFVEEAFFGHRESIRLSTPVSPGPASPGPASPDPASPVPAILDLKIPPTEPQVVIKKVESPQRPAVIERGSVRSDTAVLTGPKDMINSEIDERALSPMTVSEIETVLTIPWSRALGRSAARTLLPPSALPVSIVVPHVKSKSRVAQTGKHAEGSTEESDMEVLKDRASFIAAEAAKHQRSDSAKRSLSEALRLEYDLRNSSLSVPAIRVQRRPPSTASDEDVGGLRIARKRSFRLPTASLVVDGPTGVPSYLIPVIQHRRAPPPPPSSAHLPGRAASRPGTSLDVSKRSKRPQARRSASLDAMVNIARAEASGNTGEKQATPLTRGRPRVAAGVSSIQATGN